MVCASRRWLSWVALSWVVRGEVGRRESKEALGSVCGRTRECLDVCRRDPTAPCACLPDAPLRTPAGMALSSAAFREFPRNTSNANASVVFQLHFRKASGTSIRSELKIAAVAVVRGGGHLRVAHEEFNNFDVALLCAYPPRTVFVTAVRRPLDRLVSLYNYENNPGMVDEANNRDAEVWHGWLNRSAGAALGDYYVSRLTSTWPSRDVARCDYKECAVGDGCGAFGRGGTFSGCCARFDDKRGVHLGSYDIARPAASARGKRVPRLSVPRAQAFGCGTRHQPPREALGPADLEVAKRVLLALDFVAIVETMEAGMSRFNALFGLPQGRVKALHANDMSAGRAHKPPTADRLATIPRSVRDRFDRENVQDLALYAWLTTEYVPPGTR